MVVRMLYLIVRHLVMEERKWMKAMIIVTVILLLLLLLLMLLESMSVVPVSSSCIDHVCPNSPVHKGRHRARSVGVYRLKI